MKISTVKGTNDYLPEQVALRDYLQSVILTTYEDAGFSRISTPPSRTSRTWTRATAARIST